MKKERPTLIEDRDFPFECSDSYGVDEEFRILHWHNEMEICFIKNGSGKYLINGIEYSFTKGDIFIISNNDIHLCYDEKNLVMQVIMFDPSFAEFENSILFIGESRKISADRPYHAKLSAILSELETEYQQEQNEYRQVIRSLVLQFASLTLRYTAGSEPEYKTNFVSTDAAKIVRSVILYIEQNYDRTISLQYLAKKYNISVSYLSSCFRALTGNSPINYLIKKRISESQRLLALSDKSILEISQDCGFQSLSNFNHLFKKFIGMTPSAYRKEKFIADMLL